MSQEIKLNEIKRKVINHLKEMLTSEYSNAIKARLYRDVIEHAFQELLGLENIYHKKEVYINGINNDPSLFKKKIATKFGLLYDFSGKWSHHKKNIYLSDNELNKYELKLIELIEAVFDSKIDIDEEFEGEAKKLEVKRVHKIDFLQTEILESKKEYNKNITKINENYKPNIGDYISIFINAFKDSLKEIEEENKKNPIRLRRRQSRFRRK